MGAAIPLLMKTPRSCHLSMPPKASPGPFLVPMPCDDLRKYRRDPATRQSPEVGILASNEVWTALRLCERRHGCRIRARRGGGRVDRGGRAGGAVGRPGGRVRLVGRRGDPRRRGPRARARPGRPVRGGGGGRRGPGLRGGGGGPPPPPRGGGPA